MTVLIRFRDVIVVLFALHFALATTKGFTYPNKEIAHQNPEPYALPLALFGYPPREFLQEYGMQSERPKNCYHFYLARNMSSLLSDATKMLRQVHDKRERDWILTFIYRIKSLAEHLRSHPDSQNYEECMSVEDEGKTSSMQSESMRIPQPELYFVDDLMPNQNQKRSGAEPEPTNSNNQEPSEIDEKTQDHQQQTKQDSKDRPAETKDKIHDVKDQPISHDSIHHEIEDHLSSVAESTSESLSLKKDSEHTAEPLPTAAGTVNSELTSGSQHQPEPASSNSEENDWMIGKGGHDSDIIVSSPQPDCLSQVKCKEVMEKMKNQAVKNRDEEDELEKQLHSRRRKNAEEEQKHQQLLKERIRKALLEELAPEIKKLRTVGGSEEDLLELWKQSEIDIEKDEEKRRQENDFDYEEEGAAAGDLNPNDKTHFNYRTVDPSSEPMGNRKSTKESPYDTNDVLVQQLYDAARDAEPQYRSTRSLDPQEEYLIISTRLP